MGNEEKTSNSKHNIVATKKAAMLQYKDLSGVEGFGIGDEVINVYISDEEVIKRLPATFENIPLRFIKSGVIKAY